MGRALGFPMEDPGKSTKRPARKPGGRKPKRKEEKEPCYLAEEISRSIH